MRPLTAIAATLVSGAACVTALANLPGPAPRAEHLAHRVPSFEPAGWGALPPAAPPARADRVPLPAESATFANTYYDFPEDDGGVADTTVYTPRCEPIAQVSRNRSTTGSACRAAGASPRG